MTKVLATTAGGNAVTVQVGGGQYTAVPTDVTALGGGPTLVYRPGGTESGNVITTWPGIVAAAALIQGPKTISIDASIAPAAVPAGTWTLRDVTLTSAYGAFTFLTFSDGAHLDVGTGLTVQNLQLTGTVTSPVITIDGTTAGILLVDAGLDLTSGVFVRVTNGGAFGCTAVRGFAAGGSFECDASDLGVFGYESSTFLPNVAMGTGTIQVWGDSTTAVFIPQPSITLASTAQRTAFPPPNPLLYVVPPTTVDTTLRQLSGGFALAASIRSRVTQVIPPSIPTPLTFNAVDFADGSGWLATPNALTIPAPGLYDISLAFGFAPDGIPDSANYLEAGIAIQGTVARRQMIPVVDSQKAVGVSIRYREKMQAGWVITGVAFWSDGESNATTDVTDDSVNPQLQAALIR